MGCHCFVQNIDHIILGDFRNARFDNASAKHDPCFVERFALVNLICHDCPSSFPEKIKMGA